MLWNNLIKIQISHIAHSAVRYMRDMYFNQIGFGSFANSISWFMDSDRPLEQSHQLLNQLFHLLVSRNTWVIPKQTMKAQSCLITAHTIQSMVAVVAGCFFSPMGFFMGKLIGVKTPPKSHGFLCFKVRYLKNYNQYRCNFWFSYGQKIQPSYGKSLCASFKKWLSKVRLFGRPGLNWHSVLWDWLLIVIFDIS
jgi:hypothetical protein